MDDLRDYRFYAPDMIHLSLIAIDYIFSIFKNVFLSENAINEIRPYLIADGGDIKVVSVDNKNIVNLELLGSCENCPISDMTLKNGVEETIKKHAPETASICIVAFSSAHVFLSVVNSMKKLVGLTNGSLCMEKILTFLIV